MSEKNDNDDEDFVRIEDLEEFHHEQDEGLDLRLKSHDDNIKENDQQEESIKDIDEKEHHNDEHEQNEATLALEEQFDEHEGLENDQEILGVEEVFDNKISNDKEEKKEDFSDLKAYGEAISSETETPVSPNPPYSLILKKIFYTEDAEAIKRILTEYDLMTEDNKALIEEGLNNNILLIPQINEYTAISLIHRLRELALEIIFGLSEEVHPPKDLKQNSRGLISKKNIYQNVKKSLSIETFVLDPNDIIVTTTQNLDGRHIHKYLGVVSEHALVTLAQVESLSESENSLELQTIYDGLAENLKIQAHKLHANGVLGVQYHLAPLMKMPLQSEAQYKITCTGNAVWILDAE